MMARITNVSLTAELNCFLNLKTIVNKTINCIFDNKHFVRIIKFFRNPNITVMIYSSGKLVCVGATNFSAGRMAIRRVARSIQKVGYPVRLTNIEVRNYAAVYDTQTPVNLMDFAKHLGFGIASLNRQRFPNLIIHFDKENKEKLIFSRNGKLVLTGFKNKYKINESVVHFLIKLFDFAL